jgi:hypothetical protein
MGMSRRIPTVVLFVQGHHMKILRRHWMIAILTVQVGFRETLSLVALQFCLSSPEAKDMTTRENSQEVSVGDNR